jgi:hypothetical protein
LVTWMAPDSNVVPQERHGVGHRSDQRLGFRELQTELFPKELCLENCSSDMTPAFKNTTINRHTLGSPICWRILVINPQWEMLSKQPRMSPSMAHWYGSRRCAFDPICFGALRPPCDGPCSGQLVQRRISSCGDRLRPPQLFEHVVEMCLASRVQLRCTSWIQSLSDCNATYMACPSGFVAARIYCPPSPRARLSGAPTTTGALPPVRDIAGLGSLPRFASSALGSRFPCSKEELVVR